MINDEKIVNEIEHRWLLDAARIEKFKRKSRVFSRAEDRVQRLVNAVADGSYKPLHRFKNVSQTIVVLSGNFTIRLFYSDDNTEERYTLLPGEVIDIPADGPYHQLEGEGVILEVLGGPYGPFQGYEELPDDPR